MTMLPANPQVDDIYEAMRELGSFVDISPSDARDLFALARRHATARLRASVRVEQLMTREVVTAAPEDTLRQAARMLAGAGVSGAPVTRGGELLGVVSVKDFLPLLGLGKDAPPVALVARALAGEGCPDVPGNLCVRDVMTTPARTVEPGLPAFDAARLMAEGGIRRLPVLDGGALVGIITQTDLVRAFGDLLEEAE